MGDLAPQPQRVVPFFNVSSATVDVDTTDIAVITMLGATTINEPTGTPVDGQRLTLWLNQSSVNPGGRIIWDPIFQFARDTPPNIARGFMNEGNVTVLEFVYQTSDLDVDVWHCLTHIPSGPLVARNLANTDSATFTNTPVVILTTQARTIPGHMYQVLVNGEVEMTSSGNASTQHEIRITTDNSAPTVSSTQIGRTVVYQDPSGIPVGVQLAAYFEATSEVNLRVALVSHRPVGSTTCQWTADSDRPMHLMIIDLGPAASQLS